MIFLRLRRHRLTNKLITLLAAIWLSLALQPCAMAFSPIIPDQATTHSHCPNCPDRVANADNQDCSLSDWQLEKSVSGGTLQDLGSPALLAVAFLQHALRQPDAAQSSPPKPDDTRFIRDLPVSRQDILRL